MTTTETKQKLKEAMNDFSKAYTKVLAAINDYEKSNGSINELNSFVSSYPFDKSFDELPITEWVTAVYGELNSADFQVLNYEYLNTGGNTMVGIHEVWLPAELKTVYVYTNEEGCTISVADYIRNELEIHDYDELVLDCCDIGRITGFEKYFELYRRCLNDYIKDDCKHFGTTYRLPSYLLSDDLQKQLDADYLVWSEAESDGCVSTNGVVVVEDPDYAPHSVDPLEKHLQEIKDFRQWHDNLVSDRTTDEALDELYNCEYTLTINGKSINLPFDADTFNNIDYVLKRVIEEW